jgi:hypothetical protein
MLSLVQMLSRMILFGIGAPP